MRHIDPHRLYLQKVYLLRENQITHFTCHCQGKAADESKIPMLPQRSQTKPSWHNPPYFGWLIAFLPLWYTAWCVAPVPVRDPENAPARHAAVRPQGQAPRENEHLGGFCYETKKAIRTPAGPVLAREPVHLLPRSCRRLPGHPGMVFRGDQRYGVQGYSERISGRLLQAGSGHDQSADGEGLAVNLRPGDRPGIHDEG